MNYSLAKELKDAGFEQHLDQYDDCNNWCVHTNTFALRPEIRESACAPTLSELIEACGKELKNLHHYNGSYENTWVCNFTTDGKTMEWHGEGHTPEEAVARLWLALNTK